MLTVGRVLSTNVSQISLDQLLFRATLKSQARLMFVATFEISNFGFM